MLPVAVLWQVATVLLQAHDAFSTRCRSFSLLDGRLMVKFLARGRLFQASTVFGGRFVVIKYGDVLIDPGPRRAWPEVERFLRTLSPGSISKVLCTHYHEEHIGNAAAAAKFLGIPVYGTQRTLDEIRKPAPIPFYRKWYFGEPQPCGSGLDLRELADTLQIRDGSLLVIPSPGHCDGHVALFCPQNRVLFSGDSYMGELLTSPNGDVDASKWISTLKAFSELDVDIVLEGHGELHTINAQIPSIMGLVVREAPKTIFERKLAFLRWAKDVVAYGEARGIDYRVIEACLFPPLSYWSWSTWARDESFRFYSWGGFSRTQFVRSLAAHSCAPPSETPSSLQSSVAQAGRLGGQ